jgi:RHS repeat-associated protein
VSYTYGSSAHKHAVTSTSNGNSYSYDANGNMTRRTVGRVTYTLTYDAENRLVGITQGGNFLALYTYDGDGNRVKAWVISGNLTTAYIGNYFEWSGLTSSMKKYYYASGQRVAMRTGTINSTLNFLLGDHLGSTSLTTDSSGVRTAELRYYPWGGSRYTYQTTPTTYRYTGQREAEIGLYYYGARFYDPALGRFVQADTIIPNQGDPIAFDRFSYARNSPVRFVDPNGHSYCDSNNSLSEDCEGITELLPGASCRADINCYDAYLAYYWLVIQLGRKPSDWEVLYMTVGAEYWAYSSANPEVVVAGQEALSRNYYQACGRDGCQGSELYDFLSGYQPWTGFAGRADGTARRRADALLTHGFHGVEDGGITNHVNGIMTPVNNSWRTGIAVDHPWQWYGPFDWDTSNEPDLGYSSDDDAILAIDLGNNQGFWMFTYDQTSRFDPDAWGPQEAKPQ